MRLISRILLIAIAAYALLIVVRRPSLTRDWNADQSLLPTASIKGDLVEIRNVRNAIYRSTSDFTPRFETRALDLRKLDSMWFAVEPFGERKAAAHTFLSYGFGDQFISISVEIRKERGENFSALRGLFREYELMYVIGDERDILGLRTNHRRDEVRLYPVRTTREKMRRIFLAQLARANELALEPEFYNTLTNTCTTNIVRDVNTIAPRRVPFTYQVLLPGYSDTLAYDLGLLDTQLPLDQARRAWRVDPIAQRIGIPDDFSQRLRAELRAQQNAPPS